MKIGIDLGGTKIELLVLNEGKEVFRKRIPTPRHSYSEILNALCDLVNEADRTLSLKNVPVGIGIPGVLSKRTGLVKNANTVVLIGNPLLKDLEKKMNRSVRIENDANCFALSEAVDGAGRDAEVVFGVILGTGAGSGVVINKKCLVGVNQIAGEWGHNPLPWIKKEEWPGPLCYCGLAGCNETFISGTGLEVEFTKQTGKDLTAKEITRLALDGLSSKSEKKGFNKEDQKRALHSLELYEHRLARALAHVINLLDPEVIVLGGGMSNTKRLYENVPKLWGEFIFSKDGVANKLVPAKYGDASGVRGAAWLW